MNRNKDCSLQWVSAFYKFSRSSCVWRDEDKKSGTRSRRWILGNGVDSCVGSHRIRVFKQKKSPELVPKVTALGSYEHTYDRAWFEEGRWQTLCTTTSTSDDSLTSWSRGSPEKLVKKFSIFYGVHIPVIFVFTKAHTKPNPDVDDLVMTTNSSNSSNKNNIPPSPPPPSSFCLTL